MALIGLLSLFCEVHGPVVLMTTISTSESIDNLLPQIHADLAEDLTANCEYCQSFQLKTMPCMVSQEHNVTFLSSRSCGDGGGIFDAKGFKRTCLRCLSCESGDKWIACDNLLNGGVLTYNFRVPDHRARGMHRLCGLSVLSLGKQGIPSSKSTLSSSATKLVFPKLEEMASEMIGNPDIAPVACDKRKSLTYIHLNFSQLFSHLSLQSEEFVHFSPTTLQSNSNTMSMPLNLELLRKWALNQNFVTLLNDYFTKKKFKVSVLDPSLGKYLLQFLHFCDIPCLGLKNAYDQESCQLHLNNDTADEATTSVVIYKVTNESIEQIAQTDFVGVDVGQLLTYSRRLQDILLQAAVGNQYQDDIATIARLDLHKHTFASLFNAYRCVIGSKRRLSLKNQYDLSDFDFSWLENGSKGSGS